MSLFTVYISFTFQCILCFRYDFIQIMPWIEITIDSKNRINFGFFSWNFLCTLSFYVNIAGFLSHLHFLSCICLITNLSFKLYIVYCAVNYRISHKVWSEPFFYLSIISCTKIRFPETTKTSLGVIHLARFK